MQTTVSTFGTAASKVMFSSLTMAMRALMHCSNVIFAALGVSVLASASDKSALPTTLFSTHESVELRKTAGQSFGRCPRQAQPNFRFGSEAEIQTGPLPRRRVAISAIAPNAPLSPRRSPLVSLSRSQSESRMRGNCLGRFFSKIDIFLTNGWALCSLSVLLRRVGVAPALPGLPVKGGDKPLKRLDSWKEVRFGFRSAGFGFRSAGL